MKQEGRDIGLTSMENRNLPQDLILQILLRLPVKSLLRFRCVSKLWLYVISDPQFTKSHFELAAARTHKLVHFVASASEARTIDLDASLYDVAVTVKLDFLFTESYIRFNIMGSCRGFLFLSNYSTHFLWNPSNGFHKQLSLSPIESNVDMFTFLYGFGYDASSDDYLVVIASYDPGAANLATHFEFFSLRANSWENIEGAHLPYMNTGDEPRAGSLLNGFIHWLVFRHDASVDVIIAFDLIERNFSEIPLPVDFESEYDSNFYDLRVLGGYLSLCVTGDTAEIWMMEEYKVQPSWIKSIVVSFDEIPTKFFSPICFTKSGDIVGIDGRTGLVKYNGKGELLEHCTYSDDPYWCEADMYTESLLSLPSDGGQAGEDDRQ